VLWLLMDPIMSARVLWPLMDPITSARVPWHPTAQIA
jgi:hypothetical protein